MKIAEIKIRDCAEKGIEKLFSRTFKPVKADNRIRITAFAIVFVLLLLPLIELLRRVSRQQRR